MGKLAIGIETIIGLVQLGVTTVTAVVGAIRAQRLSVQEEAGVDLPAEEVEARCAAAEAQRVTTAAGAEARIAARDTSVDPGAGEPGTGDGVQQTE